MAEAAKRNEAVEGREVEPGSFRDQENKLFEAGHMDLGDFWTGKAAAASQEAADYGKGIAYDVTQIQNRYDMQMSPSERAASDDAAREAQKAAAAMKAAGDVDIANLQAQLGKVGSPIQLTEKMIIHPAEPYVISSEPEKRVEADLGDVIPDKPVVTHDVRAELTTPPPDAEERYRAMSLSELQNEYDRLFAKTEADLKADPKKLKAYKKALKTGVLPDDPEAENADINKVYAEIQARRRPKAEASAPAVVEKPVVQPPPPPLARVEPPVATTRPEPIVAPARAYEAKEDAGFDSTVAKYQKTFEGQHTEGNLVGLLSTLENRTPEDMLTDAEIAGVLTKDDVRAVIEANKIEEFKYAAVAHLQGLLDKMKEGAEPLEVAVPLPAEKPEPAKKAAPAVTEFPKLEPVDKMIGGAIVEATKGLPNRPKMKKEPVPPNEKVIDTLVDYFEQQPKVMPNEIKKRLAAMTSREQAIEYVKGLRTTLANLDTDTKVHEEVLHKRIGLSDNDLLAMTDKDMDKSLDRFKTLYAEAIRIAEDEIAKRDAKAAAKPVEAPKPVGAPQPVEAPAEQVAEVADPTVDMLSKDVDVIAETFLAASDAPKTLAAKLGRMMPDDFIAALKTMKRIDDAQEAELRGKTLAVLQLRDAVKKAAGRLAKKK